MSVFQNPVGFEQALEKTGQKPGFSVKSKGAVPKTKGLKQPRITMVFPQKGKIPLGHILMPTAQCLNNAGEIYTFFTLSVKTHGAVPGLRFLEQDQMSLFQNPVGFGQALGKTG
ncbi:MAG: hypothetical protein LBP23_08510 [Treponema sp.]|jgi:hypothetical protein|nr:hypothetical protein [Treponema sp.]